MDQVNLYREYDILTSAISNAICISLEICIILDKDDMKFSGTQPHEVKNTLTIV